MWKQHDRLGCEGQRLTPGHEVVAERNKRELHRIVYPSENKSEQTFYFSLKFMTPHSIYLIKLKGAAGFNMKTLFRLTIVSVLSLYLSSAHSATEEKDVNLTCAAYYYSLSLYAPKLVEDLTSDQAVKASFAFRKQLDGVMYSHKSDDAFIGKWMELSAEIAKPANKDSIAAFRGKYESTCRPLLQKAWCDAYKEFSKVGCTD
jgi:hypothetical protein